MFNNQYPYNIFSQNEINTYIAATQREADILKHNSEQQKNILQMRKAIRDYIEAARKITPDFQQEAFSQCMDEILLQAAKDGRV